MNEPINQLHSYRAHLVPKDAHAADVEGLAAAGMLPTLRLRAINAEVAQCLALRLSGMSVHSVERVEQVVAA